jgi:hypothetical protein
MRRLLVGIIVLGLGLCVQGGAADPPQRPDPAAIRPEDQKVIEMLDVLDLMELAQYMDMMRALKVSAKDEDDAQNE